VAGLCLHMVGNAGGRGGGGDHRYPEIAPDDAGRGPTRARGGARQVPTGSIRMGVPGPDSGGNRVWCRANACGGGARTATQRARACW
jgi:hypothetical protein